MAACEPSLLLDLPAELRSLIYGMALEGCMLDFRRDCKAGRDRPYQKIMPPRVLLTCQQIYAEAIELFYATVTLQLTYYSSPRLVARLLPQRRWSALRSVEVALPPFWECGDHRGRRKVKVHERFHESVYEMFVEEFRLAGASCLAKVIRIRCGSTGEIAYPMRYTQVSAPIGQQNKVSADRLKQVVCSW